MNYDRKSEIRHLSETTGWPCYGRKHCESVFTKLFQNNYLPAKVGYDKRRPHLSSHIVTGQITREDAPRKLEEPLYEPRELENNIAYFCKKMRISREQFYEFISAQPRHYTEFKNWDARQRTLKAIQSRMP